MTRQRSIVGVDWGTTHRRGYLAAGPHVSAEVIDAQGALASRGRFAPALDELLHALGPEALGAPVLMSGMVGSAFGWQEVPYLDPSVPLAELGRRLVRVPDGPGGVPRFIVPGYRHVDGDAHVDVMRGEEMQLLGAMALGRADGWFVLPGTHAKWVRLRAGRIERFWTFMTGELYAAVLAAGTLSSAAGAADGAAWQPQAFDAGLRAAASGAVTHALFGARARVVTGRMPAEHVPAYVSGVLVGAEWVQMRSLWGDAPASGVVLIGAASLAEGHARAAAHMNIGLSTLEPREVYLAALSRLAQALS